MKSCINVLHTFEENLAAGVFHKMAERNIMDFRHEKLKPYSLQTITKH